MLTELERINHLKAVLIHYANEHDNKHNGFAAIQSVQKMAGFCNEKDYVIALADGLKYGNWPWTNYSKPKESVIYCDKCDSFECPHVLKFRLFEDRK